MAAAAEEEEDGGIGGGDLEDEGGSLGTRFGDEEVP